MNDIAEFYNFILLYLERTEITSSKGIIIIVLTRSEKLIRNYLNGIKGKWFQQGRVLKQKKLDWRAHTLILRE